MWSPNYVDFIVFGLQFTQPYKSLVPFASCWYHRYGGASKKSRCEFHRTPFRSVGAVAWSCFVTLDELHDTVIEEWTDIPRETVVTLIRSMTDRISYRPDERQQIFERPEEATLVLGWLSTRDVL